VDRGAHAAAGGLPCGFAAGQASPDDVDHKE
jgi:hypothetical protein